MRHIPIYLWKEWREQRKALGVLALGLALVAIMAITYFGWSAKTAAEAFLWLPGLCGLGALLTVGSDLFSTEATGQHAQFAERLPAGVAPNYWSKLILFVCILIGSVLYGVALCYLAIWISGGEATPSQPWADWAGWRNWDG